MISAVCEFRVSYVRNVIQIRHAVHELFCELQYRLVRERKKLIGDGVTYALILRTLSTNRALGTIQQILADDFYRIPRATAIHAVSRGGWRW